MRCDGMEWNGMGWDLSIYLPVCLSVCLSIYHLSMFVSRIINQHNFKNLCSTSKRHVSSDFAASTWRAQVAQTRCGCLCELCAWAPVPRDDGKSSFDEWIHQMLRTQSTVEQQDVCNHAFPCGRVNRGCVIFRPPEFFASGFRPHGPPWAPQACEACEACEAWGYTPLFLTGFVSVGLDTLLLLRAAQASPLEITCRWA